jgi:peroxiredoxin
MAGFNNAQSLGSSAPNLAVCTQSLSSLLSNSIPDLASLLNALNSANTVVGEIRNVANTINQLFSTALQRFSQWIGQLKQQICRAFNQMEL